MSIVKKNMVRLIEKARFDAVIASIEKEKKAIDILRKLGFNININGIKPVALLEHLENEEKLKFTLKMLKLQNFW